MAAGDKVKAERPNITPDDLMVEAGRAVLAFYAGQMFPHEEATRAGDALALYKMRVATRRMRSALRIFGPYFMSGTNRRLRRGLKLIATALGEVRDLDVLLKHIETYAGSLPSAEQAGFEQLKSAIRARRAAGLEAVTTFFAQPLYQEFGPWMRHLVSTPGLSVAAGGAAVITVAEAAPREITARYEDMLALGQHIERATIDELHELRIAGKRLRYTLELFRAVLGDEADPLIQAVIAVQDHLGAFNDVYNAEAAVETIFNTDQLAESPAVEDYIAHLGRESDRLRAGFAPVWGVITDPAFSANLQAAMAPLHAAAFEGGQSAAAPEEPPL